MTFDPVAYINEPRWMESRLGLERIRELLERLGRPQDQVRFVHVAGTNGKGSTCAFLAQILQEAGYRTGLFTSPYIIEFSDRIRVNGENISDVDLTSVTLAVKEAADAMIDHPTEFELMTAVAFLHFARQQCDIVVCEVGLGGRLDSTNVIEHPEICIIASIGLDHIAVLGDTLAAIAGEKAGIIKQGVPVVSWPQEPEAMEVVERVAREHEAPITLPDFSQLRVYDTSNEGSETKSSLPHGKDLPSPSPGSDNQQGTSSRNANVRYFDYKAYSALEIGLLGSYQPSNATLAIEAVELLRQKGWCISDEALRKGLADTRWPARFEVVAEHPTFIIDGAHNVEGAKALVESLKLNFPQVFPVFIVGVLADKDYENMLAQVFPYAAMFVTITPPNPRALSGYDLAVTIREIGGEAGQCPHSVRVYSATDVADAIRYARMVAGEDGLICAFGSLYSVADLKKALADSSPSVK